MVNIKPSIFVIGASGSGKTTTIAILIENLPKLKIGTVKYIHHPEFTIDPAGKDTRIHRKAGSVYTICASPGETAVLIDKEKRDDHEEIQKLSNTLPDVDLLLFESYKYPPNNSHILLVGNSEKELDEFYEYTENMHVLGIISYQMNGEYEGIPIFNPKKTEQLKQLMDKIQQNFQV